MTQSRTVWKAGLARHTFQVDPITSRRERKLPTYLQCGWNKINRLEAQRQAKKRTDTGGVDLGIDPDAESLSRNGLKSGGQPSVGAQVPEVGK